MSSGTDALQHTVPSVSAAAETPISPSSSMQLDPPLPSPSSDGTPTIPSPIPVPSSSSPSKRSLVLASTVETISSEGHTKAKYSLLPPSRWSTLHENIASPRIADFHHKILRRPIRNRVFVTGQGKIWSSPNVETWPHNVGEGGPPAQHKERMSRISWQDAGWPAQALLPRHPQKPVGIFGSLSPMHSIERDYKMQAGGYVPRRGPQWAQLEQRLLVIAETLFTHVVFDWDASIPMTERPVAPGWYMAPQPDGDLAFSAGVHQISHVLKLAASVSLYCAIAWMKMGSEDSWIAVLEEKVALTSAEDREWLNELRGSWVCRYDDSTHMGVFVDVSTWKWPNLLHLFVQLRVPVMLFWGSDPNDVRKSRELVPGIFKPSPVEITSATLISCKVIEADPIPGEKRKRDVEVIIRRSKKDGDFAWWTKVRSKIEAAKLRDPHRIEQISELRDRWTAKGSDRVWLWTRSSLDIGNAKPWEQALKSDRQMWLEEHPPWQIRYDPVEGIWHCLEYDTLPVPDYVEPDRDGQSSQKHYDRYYKDATPRFTDSDFTILCGGGLLPMQREVAVLGRQAVVQRRRPAEPPVGYYYHREIVNAGLSTICLPSMSDVFARIGLAWRNTHQEPVYIRVPLEHRWQEGAVVNNRIPQPGEATDLEVALQTMGLSTNGLPTGKKENARAIVARQASRLDMMADRAIEMIEFVTRMSNAGHNLRHEDELKKLSRSTGNGPSRKPRGKQTTAVPLSTPFEPPYDRPMRASWLFAPDGTFDTWGMVASQNIFEFTPATCYRSPVPGAERLDSPAWLIDLPGNELSWRLAVHRATFVCQILVQCRFSSIEEIVQYAVECGVRISTVAPRHKGHGEHHKIQAEIRRKELSELRIGYRSPDAKMSVSEFESFMRTCKRKLASDATIARIALKSGGVVWRLAVEHLYGDVVFDGPSQDAVILGICERVEFQIGRQTNELVDDELSRTMEQFLVGGYSNKLEDVVSHHESVKTIFPTNAAWGALGAVASWDARQEEQYQSIIRWYRTSPNSDGFCGLQPKNVKGWRDMMRGHHKYAAKFWDGAEEYAQRWLMSKGSRRYLIIEDVAPPTRYNVSNAASSSSRR